MTPATFDIYAKILSIKEIFNFSQKPCYEIKPGIYSSIRINIKTTLGSYECRTLLVSKLSDLIETNTDYICGIETGGIYFASALADLVKKPLIIYRTHSLFEDDQQIVGHRPDSGSRIAVIDDVCATGETFKKVTNSFKNIGCGIQKYSIFTYNEINNAQKSLLNLSDFLRVAKKIGVISEQEVEFLKQQFMFYEQEISSNRNHQ